MKMKKKYYTAGNVPTTFQLVERRINDKTMLLSSKIIPIGENNLRTNHPNTDMHYLLLSYYLKQKEEG